MANFLRFQSISTSHGPLGVMVLPAIFAQRVAVNGSVHPPLPLIFTV